MSQVHLWLITAILSHFGMVSMAFLVHGCCTCPYTVKIGQGSTKRQPNGSLGYQNWHHVKCCAGWITSWNQDCWEKYLQHQIYRWYHPNGRKQRKLKSHLMKAIEEGKKAGLKLSIQKTNHGIWSHHFLANRWGKNEQWQALFSWAPKSLQMVTAAMKFKYAYSLKEKLWQN